MDDDVRAFRAASHLPPLSVCLLLASASVVLLCTHGEIAGEPQTHSAPVQSLALGVHEGHGEGEPVAAENPAPDNVIVRLRAQVERARSLREAGEPQRAATVLRGAAERVDELRLKGEVAVAVYRELGETLDATGEHEAAIEVWWQLLSMAPRHEDPARKLAASLLASGRLEEARRVAREMLHTDLDDVVESAVAGVGETYDLGGS